MDKYDGLALALGTLWFYITLMPEALYYSVLEQMVLTRVILLLGLGGIAFIYGLRDNELPLIYDTILSVISFTFISSMWGTLSSYTHVLSSRTELSVWGVVVLICFFAGSAVFYGLGGLVSKSVQSLQGTANLEVD